MFSKRPPLWLCALGLLVASVADAGPLHDAVMKGDMVEIDRLVSEGEKVTARDEYLRTPLHVAASKGQTGIARWLIAKGAEVDAATEFGLTPLHTAALAGKVDVVNLLLESGADANARTGEAEGMSTALHFAAKKGHVRVVESLLARGADAKALNKDQKTALQLVLDQPPVSVPRGMVDALAAASPVETGDTLLVLVDAIGHGTYRLVEKLAGEVHDINVRLKDDWTLLHIAVDQSGRGREGAEARDREAIVGLLLRKGADVHARTADGMTPLHLTALKMIGEEGTRNVAEMLLARGADVNARTRHGVTPLHAAAQEGNRPVAKLLLAHGADIDARDEGGMTPLHRSTAFSWNCGIIDFLIAKGADVNARDKAGMTPLGRAKEQGNANAVRVLRRHWARE